MALLLKTEVGCIIVQLIRVTGDLDTQMLRPEFHNFDCISHAPNNREKSKIYSKVSCWIYREFHPFHYLPWVSMHCHVLCKTCIISYKLAKSCTNLVNLAKSTKILHNLFITRTVLLEIKKSFLTEKHSCTFLHNFAHSCTILHILVQFCTFLHNFAQFCTVLSNLADDDDTQFCSLSSPSQPS